MNFKIEKRNSFHTNLSYRVFNVQSNNNTPKMTSSRNLMHSSQYSVEAESIHPMQLYPSSQDEVYEVDVDSFDFETHANNYNGLDLIYRLLYIADHCPKLRFDALRLAISHVIKTMNVNLYEILHQKLQQSLRNVPPGANPVDLGLPVFNRDWVESTTEKAAIKREKFDTDLRNSRKKSYKNRIRCGYNDIGDHLVDCGNLIESIKIYSKARDYCASHSHTISMYLSIIKVSIYLRNWPQVVNYIHRAESTPNETEDSNLTTYNSTLKCMAGLAELAVRKYKEAAQNFVHINVSHLDSTNVITPNDIANYGGLCALATFNRSELKQYVICNNLFKLFLEVEPEIREAIFKFYEAKYEVCLAILNKIKPRLLLDMYIGPHINQLYSNITRRAMIQYIYPYDAADLRKMALCFNTSLPDLEDKLMQLILNGHIKARIDSINKILYAKHPNQKAETYENVISLAEKYNKEMQILVLRSQMVKMWIPKQLNDNDTKILDKIE